MFVRSVAKVLVREEIKTMFVTTVEKVLVCGAKLKFTLKLYTRERDTIGTVHEGEKAHLCEICGKCFGMRGNVRKHINIWH